MLVHNWRRVLKRAWSVRIAAFWGALVALLAAWPGLAGDIPTWAYFGGSVLLGGSVAAARVLDQPGANI